MTGVPSIAAKMPSKSARCMGRSFWSAAFRASSVSARIISRTAVMRSPSKNMCSVRQSPMPSAPKPRATFASRGVSAFVRTPSRLIAFAHARISRNSSVMPGGTVGTTPAITSPAVPSSEITSPSRIVRSPAVKRSVERSIRTVPAPATQHLPMPRATTAAWDVMPPVAVRMPCAAFMPPMSSGLVSLRTRITFSPAAAFISASSAVKTTLPVTAPGLAGRPRAITSRGAVGSNDGCRS